MKAAIALDREEGMEIEGRTEPIRNTLYVGETINDYPLNQGAHHFLSELLRWVPGDGLCSNTHTIRTCTTSFEYVGPSNSNWGKRRCTFQMY